MSLQSVLVANRGEIACRIIRKLQQLGVRAIAVCSHADRAALHTTLADEVIEIGPAAVAESYLSIPRIIDAALSSGADAVHPGYGFLSENADFAQAVSDAGLTFIGPPVAAIAAMGNKAEAKRLMLAAGVPCVPGYHEADQSDARLQQAAGQIGYPLMIKAAAGGGGRGMRLAQDEAMLIDALALARSEAMTAFGSDELILERAVLDARHVEIQVFADQHGNVVHLGERDCSVQRRHQKVIEESPCPVMTDELRHAMGHAAVAAARAVEYIGAGTVEFLLDQNGEFYFLEMNTRLQVEHPVTELVTGLDLVAMQLSVANGEALGVEQKDIAIDGHAIEVRLYAEDPSNDFLPATGAIHHWRAAPAELLRTDSGIASGMEVSAFYDPMLAKLIAHGRTRAIARNKLIRGLQQTVLLGPRSNAEFLLSILQHSEFVEARADTSFLTQHYPDGFQPAVPGVQDLALIAALCLYRDQLASQALAVNVSDNLLGWSSSVMMPVPLALSIEGKHYELAVRCTPERWHVCLNADDQAIDVELLSVADKAVSASVDGRRMSVGFVASDEDNFHYAIDGRTLQGRRFDRSAEQTDTVASGDVLAPMPGTLVALSVEVGQKVSVGDSLAVLEAMKMQHRIQAPIGGKIAALPCGEGDQLVSGALIARIDDETNNDKESS